VLRAGPSLRGHVGRLVFVLLIWATLDGFFALCVPCRVARAGEFFFPPLLFSLMGQDAFFFSFSFCLRDLIG